jgi:hypothetical protein
MSYVLQKKWFGQHPRDGWEWALYAKDIEHNDTEEAAIIYADDRDGPFKIHVWDWVDQEYIAIENLPTLKAAKAMGRLLASIEAAKTANF